MDHFSKVLIIFHGKFRKLSKKSVDFFFSHKKFLKIFPKLMSLGHPSTFPINNCWSLQRTKITGGKNRRNSTLPSKFPSIIRLESL